MPALTTDKISRVSTGVRPVSTTVSTLRNTGGTTLACADLTGWSTTEKVHFVTYKIDGQGAVLAGSQADWSGIVSGSSINSLVLTGGADAGNAAGDTVEMLPTARYAKELADHILTQHNQDGTHSAITATSLNVSTTLTIPSSSITTPALAADSVTATKIDWAATGVDAGIWWEELGRTTLGSAGDTISLTTLPARKYIKVIYSLINSGNITASVRFNNDSGTNYAWRKSLSGAAETTASVVAQLNPDPGGVAYPIYGELTIINISAQEKITYGQVYPQAATTSATAPVRIEFAGKWANTASQITRIDFLNQDTGDYAIGSEVIVLGHN